MAGFVSPRGFYQQAFDGKEVFDNLYRADISLRTFTNMFNWNSIAMRSRKDDRFVAYLKAAAVKQLFKRPETVPTWVANVDWEEPMWGRLGLQSSHDDVRYKMNKQRSRCMAHRRESC